MFYRAQSEAIEQISAGKGAGGPLVMVQNSPGLLFSSSLRSMKSVSSALGS